MRFLFFYLLSFFIFLQQTSYAKFYPASMSLKVGSRAPAMTGKTRDGKFFTLSNYRGKSVVICYFTVGCAACRVLMPRLEKYIYQKFKSNKNFKLVLIARCQPSKLKKFFGDKKIMYPVVLDPKRKLTKKYDVKYMPSIFFVGKNGLIKYCFAGCEAKYLIEMAALIEKELKTYPSKSTLW